jgi:hypothetical protein
VAKASFGELTKVLPPSSGPLVLHGYWVAAYPPYFDVEELIVHAVLVAYDGGNLVKATVCVHQGNLISTTATAIAFWSVLGQISSEQAGTRRPARIEKVIPLLKTSPTSRRGPRWGNYAHQHSYFQHFSARSLKMACFNDERHDNVGSILSIS